jgi:predicted MFS family arabinose efflux permease
MEETRSATKLTRYQWTILLVAWLGWVFDVFDAAIFNFTKTSMLTEMIGKEAYAERGVQIEAWIQGIFLAGWALGGLLFGMLADKWGRTRTLTLTILVYSVFTGLTVFCQEPWHVGLARFITALGIGGEWAAGAALVAEVMPDRARAAAAAMLQSAAAFGPAIAALVQLPLKSFGWQAMYLVGLAPALVCVVIRFFVKEPEGTSHLSASPGGPLAELWSNPAWRRNALIAMVIGAVVVTGAGTATFWAPNLLDAANAGLSKEAMIERKSYGILISHVGTLLGVLIVPWLCTVFGRKKVIATFFALTPLAVVGVANLGGNYATLLWILPIINFFAIGISAALALYFPELFPTRIRATGAGLAYNVGRVFAIAMPVIIGKVIGDTKSIGAGFLLSAGIYVFGLIAISLAPETRGKPLPE